MSRVGVRYCSNDLVPLLNIFLGRNLIAIKRQFGFFVVPPCLFGKLPHASASVGESAFIGDIFFSTYEDKSAVVRCKLRAFHLHLSPPIT